MIVDTTEDRIEFLNIQILALEEEMSNCKNKASGIYYELLRNYQNLIELRFGILKI